MKSRLSKFKKLRPPEVAVGVSPDQTASPPNTELSTKVLYPFLKGLAKTEVEEAKALVGEQAEAALDAVQPEYHGLVFEGQECKERFEQIKAQRQDKEQILAQTPTHEKQSSDKASKPRLIDRVFCWVMGVAAVMAMVLSAVNMAGILLSSYEPIFLENSIYLWALSCLTPLASLATKLLPHSLDNHDHKIWYARGIYALTLVVVLRWLYLVSVTYHGGGDFSDVMDSGNSDLIFTQLLMEILIGGAMVLRISEISEVYAPMRLTPNPDYKLQQSDIQELRDKEQKALKHYTEVTTQIQKLKGQRKTFINSALSEYAAMKARHEYLSQ